MNCYFWNIDRDHQEYFVQELLGQGRLRQGWGYRESLDLRRIKQLRQKGQPLSEKQEAAWSRCHEMLDRIEEGDLVAVKNVPDGSHFTLVRVQGEYHYDADTETGDHGHFLPVEVVDSYHKQAQEVSTKMVRALNREQYPIRITNKHADAVKNLLSLERESAQAPEPFKEKIDRWRGSLAQELKESILDDLSPREAEHLVLEMLRSDELDVSWTAGPNERGADLSTDAKIGYGLSTDIAIQVKLHTGSEGDLTGLQQIEQAFEERGVDAGLLVTFANELSEEVDGRLQEMQEERQVEVLYGDDLYLRLLELVADSEHTIG